MGDQISLREFPYKMITSDDLEQQGYEWGTRAFSRDAIPEHLDDDTYIYNLDKSTGAGTHWVTFAVKDSVIYYIDPFGSHLKGHNGMGTRELKQYAKQNGYNMICGNESQFQDKYSWLCGYYALYFASKLKKHWNKLNPETFDMIVQKGIDKFPTDHNVSIITKWAKNKGLL